MNMKKAKIIFKEAVNNIAQALSHEYGVSIRMTYEQVFEGESCFVRIMIVLDPNSIVIQFQPVTYNEAENEMISLSWILMILEPQLQFNSKILNIPQEIPQEVERQIHILMQYCSPLLKGDFSAWPRVMEFRKSIHGPAENQTKDEWAQMMKQKLFDALEKKNYVMAHQLCWSIKIRGVDMNREEIERCHQVDREMEKMRRYAADEH